MWRDWCGFFLWRQVEGNGFVLVVSFVGTIAKWLVLGKPTTAKGYRGAATKAVGLAGFIDDFEVALELDGAVRVDGEACGHGKMMR